MNITVQTVTPVSGEMMTISTPNPFATETSFNVNVPQNETYTINVYDVLGRQVKTLHNGVLGKGNHAFVWNGMDNNGTSVNNGMYIIRTEANGVSTTQNVVISR
ncbi:MAG: T9SS type A sorting domain-containing protein [Candidatus Kapabacteria bacterium]|nr:T9SS type A sorting domain-containing protein [Candidatus Kapabacteria bacterium]